MDFWLWCALFAWTLLVFLISYLAGHSQGWKAGWDEANEYHYEDDEEFK